MLLYTGEYAYQTTHSMLITVEPKLVVDTLLCPKFIVFDLCNHISIQGKLLVLNFSLFGGFTGLEGNIRCQILGGALPPPPQSEYWGGSTAPPRLLRPGNYPTEELFLSLHDNWVISENFEHRLLSESI